MVMRALHVMTVNATAENDVQEHQLQFISNLTSCKFRLNFRASFSIVATGGEKKKVAILNNYG